MIVNVDDINDNFAEFETDNLNLTLMEHVANGLEILKMNATDKDKVGFALFSFLISSFFQPRRRGLVG